MNMKKINDKLFKYIILSKNIKNSKIIFDDKFVKIKYSYDKYSRITIITINLKEKINYLMKESSLFLLTGNAKDIQLVYSDKYIRIFRSNTKNENYLISILI